MVEVPHFCIKDISSSSSNEVLICCSRYPVKNYCTLKKSSSASGSEEESDRSSLDRSEKELNYPDMCMDLPQSCSDEDIPCSEVCMAQFENQSEEEEEEEEIKQSYQEKTRQIIDSEIEPQRPKILEIMNIILLQSSEGFWAWNQLIAVLPQMQNFKDSLGEYSEADDEYATGFALLYLNHYYKSTHYEWILVEKKALKWLKRARFNYEEFQRKALKFITN